ncbi:hypothetical protein ACFQZS_05565 [Mucilaginibacter calamicampi]|uniref:Lipocalin-like domain-containing protein n=1 Tax=Mucilaginibacter calamicampi TaxID=1302352 RepID=A0ABW2YU93_9SPHI
MKITYHLKPKLITAAFFAFLCLSSCHPLSCIWDLGFDKVKNIQKDSLIGNYDLTDYSKKMMRYEGNYKGNLNSEIILKSNNTFEIVNAPDWLINDFGEAHGQYITKSGKWNLSCENGTCIMELEGVQAGEIVFQKSNKLYILLSIGDTDDCQGLAYMKNQ